MSSNDEEITDNLDKNDFSVCSLRRSKRKPSESSSSNEVGTHRHNKRIIKTHGDLICPVCDLTLRAGDIEPHYQLECEKLSKILNISSTKFGSSRGRPKIPSDREVPLEQNEISERAEFPSSVSSIPSRSDVPITSEYSTGDVNWPSTSSHSLSSSNAAVKNKKNQEGHEEFKRVKVNRLLRRQCIKWKAKSIQVDETICPVCQEPVPVESAEELQVHADGCLRKQQTDTSDDDEVDVMGDEYEWCGMKKIRITSLLKSQGQLEALGTMITKGNEDEDVDVCVQSSNEDILGPPQYFQQDLDIEPNTSLDRSLNGLETESESENNSIEDVTSGNEPEETEGDAEGAAAETENKNIEGSQAAIIAALQMKIAEMEERGTFICHICHGPYIVPVTSTICWHVHCEKCWLQALSSQKLCPQCKCIVSPTDLRKIYL